MSYLWLALATAIAAVAYRCGGAAKTGRWYDFLCQTKTRDAGVATVSVLVLYFLCRHSPYIVWHILSVLCSGLCMFGALTWSGKKKGQESKWWNWAMLGAAYGVAAIPYSISMGDYTTFAVRACFLMVSTMVWSEHIENVVWEECGRGALIIVSMILFI